MRILRLIILIRLRAADTRGAGHRPQRHRILSGRGLMMSSALKSMPQLHSYCTLPVLLTIFNFFIDDFE